MQIAILLEDEMEPVPEGIEIASDYGYTTIRAKGDYPRMQRVPVSGTSFVHGRHVIVSGDEEALKTWLRPFGEVWVSKGAVMLQEFESLPVK